MRVATRTILTLVMLAGPAFGGGARPYRGPVGDLPRGIEDPSAEGAAGTERLWSPTGQYDGRNRWEFWWELNRDRHLRAALAADLPDPDAVPTAALVFGGERSVPTVEGETVRRTILPVLLLRLKAPDPAERARAALALGQVGDPAVVGHLVELAERDSGEPREAAILALGLTGDPGAASFLRGFAGRAGIAAEDRAFGVLALGLLGDSGSAEPIRHALAESLAFRGHGVEEFQAACALALGLIGGREQVPALAKLVGSGSLRSGIVRSCAARSLGRIGDAAAAPALIRALGDGDVEVRRAAALALGDLGGGAAVPALLASQAGDGDLMVRGFAAIALGSIGGEAAEKALAGGLDVKQPLALRGFCAVALGLTGKSTHAARLRELLSRRSDSSLAGAASIALGLLRDRASLPALREVALDASRDDDLRGYATLAAAMTGDPVARAGLPKLARAAGAAGLRRGATLAAGLLSTTEAGPTLLASLFEEVDPFVRGAAVSALALFPRDSVTEILTAVVETPGFSQVARQDALAALGALALRGGAGPAERLAAGLNYRALPACVSRIVRRF